MNRILDFSGIDKITEHKLADVYGVTYAQVMPFVNWLNQYCETYEINTSLRLAAFLAQVGHESGRMRYVEEIASGRAYEGRLDLGNTEKGDGMRFKGRGLIQITGRANYTELSNDVHLDFVSNPLELCYPEYAVLSACWFWSKRDLNKYADAGEFKEITRRINGGYNGLEDREKLYHKCKRMLNI